MKGGVKMCESSLPVWAIILILGAIVNFGLGFLNPFLAKSDKESAEEFCRKKSFDGDQTLTVKLRYHFTRAAYFIIAILAHWAAFVAFCVEDLSKFAGVLGGGVFSYILAVVIALFATFLAGCVATIVIAAIAEDNNVRSIRRHYARSGVKVVDDYDYWYQDGYEWP